MHCMQLARFCPSVGFLRADFGQVGHRQIFIRTSSEAHPSILRKAIARQRHTMTALRTHSWLRRRLNEGLRLGLSRSYKSVRVEPQSYLRHVRLSYGLPIDSFAEMKYVPLEYIDLIARQTLAASTKWAALEGAGFGLGGFLLIVPDMGILSAITIRLIQKLSLLYGFEYATEEESVMLWIAAASAAGVELGRDFLEKQAAERIVPRIIERMATRMSTEVAEKWGSRLLPAVGGVLGGTLNYYFVREWGHRAQEHFRHRHAQSTAFRAGLPDAAAQRARSG
jgi:hypothetical protein